MKKLLTFKLEAKALSKERPRSAKGGHFYTPKRTADYEEAVKFAAIRALPEDHSLPTTEAVLLEVHTTNVVPKSWKPRERYLAMRGLIFPSKGDLDNRVKAVQDALNGVLYVDDVQIVNLIASMRYGEEDAVFVTLYDILGSENEANNEGSARMG